MGKRGPKPKYTDLDLKKMFNEVLALVEAGYTITDAVKPYKLDRSGFYLRLSKEQKQKLKTAKVAHARYGLPFKDLDYLPGTIPLDMFPCDLE